MSTTAAQIALLLLSVATLAALLRQLLHPTLLRLLPIISSIISLQFAYDEYAFLCCWVQDSYRHQADALLPAWFTHWGPWGTRVVFTSFSLSLGAGFANIAACASAPETGSAKFWYAAGASFAALHLLIFGPRALKLLGMIRRGEPEGASTASLGKWLEMHAVRSFTIDLPAAICFIVAGFLSLEAADGKRSSA